MDDSWLNSDYILDLRLGSQYYIYKGLEGNNANPIIDVKYFTREDDIFNTPNYRLIRSSGLSFLEKDLLKSEFNFFRNKIIKQDINDPKICDLIIPYVLEKKIKAYLEKRSFSCSSILIEYCCAITQNIYWGAIFSNPKDDDYEESIVALKNFDGTLSLAVKTVSHNYTIKDFQILNEIKRIIQKGLFELGTWSNWTYYFETQRIPKEHREQKILQACANAIAGVLEKTNPELKSYSVHSIVGNIIQWARLPNIYKSKPDYDALRARGRQLLSSYKRETIKAKKYNQVSINSSLLMDMFKSVSKWKIDNSKVNGLEVLLAKYELEGYAVLISRIINQIPDYEEDYWQRKLDEHNVLFSTEDKLSPSVKAILELNNTLILEVVSLLPFDLIQFVKEFDQFLLSISSIELDLRQQLVAKILFKSELFLNPSITDESAYQKVKFWLSVDPE